MNEYRTHSTRRFVSLEIYRIKSIEYSIQRHPHSFCTFYFIRKHNQHLYPPEPTHTSQPTPKLHQPLYLFGKNIFIIGKFSTFLLLIFQAVFDSLFLIFSNSIFAVSALIWPHQVQIMELCSVYGNNESNVSDQ